MLVARYGGASSQPHFKRGIRRLIKPSETADRRPDLQLFPQLLNQLLFIAQITDSEPMSEPKAGRQRDWICVCVMWRCVDGAGYRS